MRPVNILCNINIFKQVQRACTAHERAILNDKYLYMLRTGALRTAWHLARTRATHTHTHLPHTCHARARVRCRLREFHVGCIWRRAAGGMRERARARVHMRHILRTSIYTTLTHASARGAGSQQPHHRWVTNDLLNAPVSACLGARALARCHTCTARSGARRTLDCR